MVRLACSNHDVLLYLSCLPCSGEHLIRRQAISSGRAARHFSYIAKIIFSSSPLLPSFLLPSSPLFALSDIGNIGAAWEFREVAAAIHYCWRPENVCRPVRSDVSLRDTQGEGLMGSGEESSSVNKLTRSLCQVEHRSLTRIDVNFMMVHSESGAGEFTTLITISTTICVYR